MSSSVFAHSHTENNLYNSKTPNLIIVYDSRETWCDDPQKT